jgi:hypothetical protein
MRGIEQVRVGRLHERGGYAIAVACVAPQDIGEHGRLVG